MDKKNIKTLSMSMHKPIVFFDSGIGGIPYLSDLRAKYPNENYIYIADNNNFPYGEKEESFLREVIIKTISKVIKNFDPKVIILACNTASVTALHELRQLTNIPIVGVVPAIKTAVSITKNNRIGVLATNRTVNGEYIKKLIDEFSANKEVLLVGASGIVEFVENTLYKSSNEDIISYISKSVSSLKKNNVDTVVLGCTHFIHVAKEIGDALGRNVKVIDSREGVTNQVCRVVSLEKSNDNFGKALFYLTYVGENIENYNSVCNNSNLIFKGEYAV